MGMGKKILFITGSMNQTSQMFQIAGELPEYDCWFSQMFSDFPLVRYLNNKTSLLDKTIISRPHRKKAEAFLRSHGCNIDYEARLNTYDLVVCCSDLILPAKLRAIKTIWVQEGMIDRVTFLSKVVKALKASPTLCFNTSLNGSTNKCDLYCAASEGYKQYISRMGTDMAKVYVTGMLNYDNAAQYLDNDFLHHDYIMVATTDMRETARPENRVKFIKHCVAIAGGRPLLFKLHPNENFKRAIKEIEQNTPKDTLIFTEGNTSHMIANCLELITQYSTVVYTGIALGKKVHSWFDVNELYRLAPLQNGGTSARNIAGICRAYVEFKGSGQEFIQSFPYPSATPVQYYKEKESMYAG